MSDNEKKPLDGGAVEAAAGAAAAESAGECELPLEELGEATDGGAISRPPAALVRENCWFA